ncbi:hypothetical protein AB0E20_31320, partial [Streptomyces sp. NPDC047966]
PSVSTSVTSVPPTTVIPMAVIASWTRRPMSVRSAHAFVHGDLPAALGSNAAAVAGYLAFAVVWVVWLVRAARGRRTRIVLAPAWWWLVGSLLAVFSVVRNLPFGTLLAP